MFLIKLIRNILIKIGNPVFRLIVILLALISRLNKWFINTRFRLRFRILPRYKIPWFYFLISLPILVMALAGFVFYREFLADLPSVNQIYLPPKMATKIVDRNGNLLYQFYDQENRSWVPIERVPDNLINATLAIEDKDFYHHKGISLKGLVKAIIYDFKKNGEDKPRGGSTITQQLVKNVFLGGEKTFRRKIREAVLAVILESKLTKKEILERYFNQVAYGGDTYGAQEASLKYFGKNVWELDLAESAFLAGLPAAPSSYSPFGTNPQYAYERQRHVLEEMANAGFIKEQQKDQAMGEPIKLLKEKRKIKAPHFVFYIKDILEDKYGFDNFGRQGLTITTSLDLDIQKMAETEVKNEVNRIRNLNISNGAALVIDTKTGDVLAMVGSKDYNADDIDGKYNIVTALRQPGSSIKPINYLLALQKGWTLASMIDDSPVSYDIKGQNPYTPRDYTGRYLGRVSLKTALASSLNVPSVRLLAENGVGSMIDLARQMGISTWQDKSRYGLSLALGSGEVKMIELAQAYDIFANLGQKVEVNPILKIQNYLGETVYQKEVERKDVVEPGYAFLIDKALSDNQARAPIFGLNSKLVISGKTVAVKTGTTNSLKDNWCIGWTPEYLVSTWVGNNNGTPMSYVASGVTGATPIWQNIMTNVLKDKPDKDWPMPESIHKSNSCGKEEYFINDSDRSIHCPSSPTPSISY